MEVLLLKTKKIAKMKSIHFILMLVLFSIISCNKKNENLIVINEFVENYYLKKIDTIEINEISNLTSFDVTFYNSLKNEDKENIIKYFIYLNNLVYEELSNQMFNYDIVELNQLDTFDLKNDYKINYQNLENVYYLISNKKIIGFFILKNEKIISFCSKDFVSRNRDFIEPFFINSKEDFIDFFNIKQ